MPSGTPKAIMPLILPIEILSYFSRVISLAVRLFANMMSGHTLLHILVSFLFSSLLTSMLFYFVDLLPYLLLQCIILMELSIAFLQIYVFLVLSALYLLDTQKVLDH